MVRYIQVTVVCLAVAAGCGDGGSLATEGSSSTMRDCACRLATQFDNLALCVSPSTAFAPSHVYSSSWDATTQAPGCEPWRNPQPAPTAAWTGLKVSSACQGTAQVCVSIRAGDVKNLSADDCTLATRCSSITYTTPNQIVESLPLAGWTAESSGCAQRHEQTGAYLEFTVQSDTLGCGMGVDQTIRVGVCPARCQTDPKGAGCEVCGSGATPVNF
jgi:hypothetical protein